MDGVLAPASVSRRSVKLSVSETGTATSSKARYAKTGERVPRVAIGVPVYNGEAFLAEALESLSAQTFGDFEIVVSDNASTDATEAICRDHAARDPRLRYVRQEVNLGAVPNFNRVFELSNSPLFKWAAHDDLHDPTYLEKTVGLLDERPDVAWAHSRSSHIDPAGRLLDEVEALDVSYAAREADGAAERFAAVLLGDTGCLDAYGIIRSDALRSTPCYLTFYGAEKILMAELALLGRYAEVPETLFHCRVSGQGSGALESAEEQQAFIDPHGKAKGMVRLRLLKAYNDAIARSAPDAVEAAKARLALVRWMAQVSKWRRIALAALKGRGQGGRNVERLERLQRPERDTSGMGTREMDRMEKAR